VFITLIFLKFYVEGESEVK